MQYALIEEMQGWQEEEDHDNILEFCANQQRFSFKLNFHIELEKITNVICKTEQKLFVSVTPLGIEDAQSASPSSLITAPLCFAMGRFECPKV